MHCDLNLCLGFYASLYLASLRAEEALVSLLRVRLPPSQPRVAPETDKRDSFSSLSSNLFPGGSLAVHALQTPHAAVEGMQAQASDEPWFGSWLYCSAMG